MLKIISDKYMKSNSQYYALIAALMFGASAPLSKLLLGDIPPLQLAGLLYLGSGAVLLLLKLLQISLFKNRVEAGLQKAESYRGWLELFFQEVF